ncbi:hypothetical protein [Bradyrhizobium archetypum]|uniref:Uncharacterized protein n=1 Tax=Bradyrhizobium archetypum TaxID=2721160 RepID=A0A7Y4H091_9BRAD|nr:hypothetical protein [Bradyrhizobium archetypum]NOJ44917.1 hypothetical protein [Bradyrhizobium archetypum]
MPIPILLDKGTFRLSWENKRVHNGKWYFGFICSKCKAKIFALDDPTQGQAKPPIAIGRGKFSAPCRQCKTEELVFEASDLVPLQAEQDDGPELLFRRRKPSGKARQKLSNRYPKAKASFGLKFIEERPECAVIFARCVVNWSYVENQTALLLAKILKINTEPALAMFLAMQNSRVQVSVITAAAKSVLSPDDFRLFQAMMNIRRSVESARNHLVHGVIGGSMSVENGILWSDQKDHASHTAIVWGTDYTQMETKHLDEVFVYEADDLETIAQDLEWLHGFIGSFWGYIGSSNAEWRAERYHQLCAEPRVQAELHRMKQADKNSPSTPAQ